MADGASDAVLAVQELEHRFGTRQVLRGLSFDIARREVVGLLGPNGCGKSTALKVICGLLIRQGGVVTAHGRRLDGPDVAFRRDLGVVFQSPSLDLKLTARENLALAGMMQGLPRADIAERVDETLSACGLTSRAKDLVGTFSGGMRRRLDLGRAMLHAPTLLIMDEPTAGLDERAFRDTWAVLDRLRRAHGTAVLIATHRPDEAALCDRLVVIQDGAALRIDTPDELVRDVSGDVITIVCVEPEEVAAQVRDTLHLEARVDDGRVIVPCERGQEVIVKVVEHFEKGRLKSISMRRPSLADVFLHITGVHLDRELAA